MFYCWGHTREHAVGLGRVDGSENQNSFAPQRSTQHITLIDVKVLLQNVAHSRGQIGDLFGIDA